MNVYTPLPWHASVGTRSVVTNTKKGIRTRASIGRIKGETCLSELIYLKTAKL